MMTWLEERLHGRLPETPTETLDRFYIAAVEAVSGAGFASTQLLQDRFDIGYYRAHFLIHVMHRAGIVGQFDNDKLLYPLIEARGFY